MTNPLIILIYADPEVNISSISELFESNHVTVTLKWTSESSVQSVAYNVSVVPQGAVKFNGSTTAQLTLTYNTLYNVSILAAVQCGLNATTSIVLKYGEFNIHSMHIILYV